jgi:hypothetical protein
MPFLINSVMKIREVLNEGVTDIVARFYKEASKDCDRYYNPEDVKYKEQNAEYYDKYFKEWFNEDVVQVFTKPVTRPQPEYTNKPKEDNLQSPGYRGLQYALAAAGLPYNHEVQRYEVNPAKIIATAAMDAARNNNGQ